MFHLLLLHVAATKEGEIMAEINSVKDVLVRFVLREVVPFPFSQQQPNIRVVSSNRTLWGFCRAISRYYEHFQRRVVCHTSPSV